MKNPNITRGVARADLGNQRRTRNQRSKKEKEEDGRAGLMALSLSSTSARERRRITLIRETSREDSYEGPLRLCKHNLVAPRWTSWTNDNPGRRFYGCRYYYDKVRFLFVSMLLGHFVFYDFLLKAHNPKVVLHVQSCIK